MKRLLPIEPTEEMLDIMAGTRWRNLPLSKQAAEVEAYKKLVRLGETPPDYDAMRAKLKEMITPAAASIGPMPDEIKVRFAARKQAHPAKVIWAMCANGEWYVYAQTRRVANRWIKSYTEQGFHIFTEVQP